MGNDSNIISELRVELEKYSPESIDIKQRILVIDDNSHNLRSFKAMLRKKAIVFVANNLSEANDILEANEVDVVFCDYKMPKINGAEVLSSIKDKYPKVMRVSMSAYTTPETRREVMQKSNTTEFLQKPFTIFDVFNSISNVASA